MKTAFIKGSVILLMLIAVLILSNPFFSAMLDVNQPKPETSSLASAKAGQQSAVTSALGVSVPTAENELDSDLSDARFPVEPSKVPKVEKQKMRFEDDWCIAAIDLDQHEFAYFQRELNDWALTRGQIRLPHSWLPDLPLDELGQLILPYLEISKTELDTHIEQDNEFAMLVAISRNEFSLRQRQQIAQRLVTKGHTGNALSYLVNHELIHAEMEYQKQGGINAAIEARLHRIMAYVAYGIEHGDLSASHSYLSYISGTDFPVVLSDYFILISTNNVSQYFDELKHIIDQARSKSAISLPSANELPKAAKHQYEMILASLYIDYPAQLQSLQRSLATSVGDRLTPSDCVNKQVTFFSEHVQRAQERINRARTELNVD